MSEHIQQLYLADGFPCKKVSGELHGTCPQCGHPSHFVVRAEGKKGDRQCPELGSFFCRNCDISGKTAGNAITYLMAVRDMSFVSACEYVGYELPNNRPQHRRRRAAGRGSQSSPPNPAADQSVEHDPAYIWYPEKTEHPDWVYDPDKWAEHALKFVDACHAQILERQSALDWFAKRGVPLEMVRRLRLGFNPGQERNGLSHQNNIKTCSGWGMRPVKDDGTAAKYFALPAGLVIPCWSGPDGTGDVVRIQVRKLADEARWIIKGSIGYSGAHHILNPGKDVAMVLENERDGMAIAWVCPEVTVIPLGSAKGKSCAADHVELRDKKLILMALDPDRTNRTNRERWERDYPGVPCPVYAFGAGIEAVDWWYEHYPQSQPWVIQGCGDIGEAILAGQDVGAWLRRGIAYYKKILFGEGFESEPASEPETKLQEFCRLLHLHGMYFQWDTDFHCWSCGPEPVGLKMYEVPSDHIRDLMYDDEVWPYIHVCGRVDSRPWTGKMIEKFFYG